MSKAIKIKGKDIFIKEQDGQRVVTFSDIDKIHNRPPHTARSYFYQNITMFKQNKDFILFEGNKGRILHMITASGYLVFRKLHLNDMDDEIIKEMLSSYFIPLEDKENLTMKNELQIFNNPEFGNIRTVMIDDKPYFVGKDVATALGYTNPQKAVRDHVEEEDRGMNEMDTPSGKQNLAVINESGLYALIFGSKLESAKRFKRWVTSEVLPELRKTGSYAMPGATEQTATVTVTETSADMYMEASKIMAGCLEHNTPYVINILRHIIPDIGLMEEKEGIISAPQHTEITVQTEKPKTKRYIKQGVPIDIQKMLTEMGNQGISVEVLAEKANVSSVTISNWIAGKHQPVLQNRINICTALGKDSNFLTPRRRRNVMNEEGD